MAEQQVDLTLVRRISQDIIGTLQHMKIGAHVGANNNNSRPAKAIPQILPVFLPPLCPGGQVA